MRPCWYAFQGVACILSPYGAFTEIPPALPGDVYLPAGLVGGYDNTCIYCKYMQRNIKTAKKRKSKKVALY